MKRALITGKGSYIGTSFEKWLSKWANEYQIETIDMISAGWRKQSFSRYDAILHVAGIAHVSADPKMEGLYYKVNRDLAIETAAKAKAEGVKQFIFMSSMIVYGDDARIGEKKVITSDTVPQPSNFYGRSKLEADLAIQAMSDDEFKTVIIRTPMVYGPGCKGNFPKLLRLAKICPVFPDIENERSMIYIDNLCEFLRLCIDSEAEGVFFPQNREYVCTKEVLKAFRKQIGKETVLTRIFNPLLRLLSKYFSYMNKIFGNRVYDKNMSLYDFCSYNVIDFKSSLASISNRKGRENGA